MLHDEKLEISNTGEPLKETPEALFERFKKDNQSGESMGLGLSIVKKICDVSDYHIRYHYRDGWHHILVHLKRIKTSELLQNSYKIESESVRTIADKKG
jgi:K+-sensing histidine kinase KdpD